MGKRSWHIVTGYGFFVNPDVVLKLTEMNTDDDEVEDIRMSFKEMVSDDAEENDIDIEIFYGNDEDDLEFIFVALGSYTDYVESAKFTGNCCKIFRKPPSPQIVEPFKQWGRELLETQYTHGAYTFYG